MERITEKQLEAVVTRINKMTGSPETPWKRVGDRNAEGGQMKIKTTKQLCNARLSTHSLDGTLHVCKLPLNHKGPHRCGRVIGTLNATRRMRVCGRSWSKKNAK